MYMIPMGQNIYMTSNDHHKCVACQAWSTRRDLDFFGSGVVHGVTLFGIRFITFEGMYQLYSKFTEE